MLKQGDTVDAVILAIKPPAESQPGRISLGFKQTLSDPWSDVTSKFPVGSQIEGPVTKIMPFGAFVQIAEGIEGLVHVSEISADKRINHPQDVLRAGQVVKAQVLGIAPEKRQIKLSMKQLIPTSIDEYIAEHKPGDIVSGRVVDESPTIASVELGEGIRAKCRTAKPRRPLPNHNPPAKPTCLRSPICCKPAGREVLPHPLQRPNHCAPARFAVSKSPSSTLIPNPLKYSWLEIATCERACNVPLC